MRLRVAAAVIGVVVVAGATAAQSAPAPGPVLTNGVGDPIAQGAVVAQGELGADGICRFPGGFVSVGGHATAPGQHGAVQVTLGADCKATARTVTP